jgi:SAM-dependent methyltransferase
MNRETDLNIFRTSPVETIKNIPIFSSMDKYIENYQKIALDHLQAARPGEENPFMEEVLWKKLEDSTRALINKHVLPGSKILDVGVGLGRVIGPLESFDRYGIDISLDYLLKARDKGINVCLSKIEDMPYRDSLFDAVVVCDVLEHVFDLNACCENILRVLKPGGILIIRVPFKEDLDVYLREDLPYEYIHLRSFDAASLRLLFSKVFGMRYIESSTVAPYLQGAPRLKLQLLPEITRIELYALIDAVWPKESIFKRIVSRVTGRVSERHTLTFLRGAVDHSLEDLVNWIYKLRDEDADSYAKIEELLVHGIEINAVFKK